MKKKISLSPLGKTWIFDIDGTIFKHNGYKLDGADTLLPGVKVFFERNIKDGDVVIFITSRSTSFAQQTSDALRAFGLRYDYIIYEAPYGERILINDKKPSGLNCSIAVSTKRDEGLKNVTISIDGKK